MKEVILNEENFDKVILQNEKPVLVDFWATWCGPCKMMAPVLEELAASRDDIIVGKVNVDDCPNLSSRFGIFSIPTLILFKNGEESDRAVGYMPLEKLLETFGL